MKGTIVLFFILCSLNSYSQSLKEWITTVKGDTKKQTEIYNTDSIIFKNKSFEYKYMASECLIKSAEYSTYSLVCAGLGSISAIIGASLKHSNDPSRNKNIKNYRKLCYVIGGSLGVAAIISQIVSINYKIKAGKNMQLGIAEEGGFIKYSF